MKRINAVPSFLRRYAAQILVGSKCVARMNIKRRIFLVGLFGGVALSGCGEKKDRPVVSIQQTSPSGDSPLLVGQTVIFEVNARVHGLSTEGSLGLHFQGADGTVLGECDPIRTTNGLTTKLTAVAVIPQTSAVRIFVPLYLAGSDKTEVMDMRDFKVVGKMQ